MLRLGTRGSPLALWQARTVEAALLAAHPGLAVEIVPIRTTGDKVRDRPLHEIGGKGLFTKEIEEALIERRIDIAVHSMKDVPTWLPEGLVIGAVLEREDPRDALIGAGGLAAIPRGAVCGTVSLRRQALLLHHRPDLRVVALRGNVETRLRKIEQGELDVTVLALAGLKRLGLEGHAGGVLDPEVMLPAAAQGAIGVELRADDTGTRERLAAIDHHASHLAVLAERTMLDLLDGSCRTPIGGWARLNGDQLTLDGLVVMPDGTRLHRTRVEGPAREAVALGRAAGETLRAEAGAAFFEALS